VGPYHRFDSGIRKIASIGAGVINEDGRNFEQ
jgi:hypothetical protein